MQPGITMVIRSLAGGGAELVMSLMCRYWVEKGIRVSLITSAPASTDAYHLPPEVRRVYLPFKRPSLFSRLGFPWNLRRLREALRAENNQVVLSFMDRSNIPVILASRGLGLKVIVAERIDPRPQGRPWFNRALMHVCYPLANAVTVMTENVKREWAETFLDPQKVHVIHNPVRKCDVDAPVPEWVPEKFICCMGRLHPQKGFDRLFNILPDVFKQFPKHKVVILGEGPYRKKLEKQLTALGLTERVLLPGFVPLPHNIMRRADLFVLCSRYEGFPNALLEAMSIGMPVVSFDCPSGPRYLIDHGTDGILVPCGDAVLLRNSICALLADPAMRLIYGAAAKEKILANCSLPLIMDKWEELIDAVCHDRKMQPIVTDINKIKPLDTFESGGVER